MAMRWRTLIPSVLLVSYVCRGIRLSADDAEDGVDQASPFGVSNATRFAWTGSLDRKRNGELAKVGGVENVPLFPKLDFRGIYLWDWFTPEETCMDLDRLGRWGDGGKWVCGIENLAVRPVLTPEGKPTCVGFSYGINTDASFEVELLKAAPGCIVHGFDPTITDLPVELRPTAFQDAQNPRRHARATWHKMGVGHDSGGVAATGLRKFPWVESLKDSMERLGVDFIDMLKIDVEGAEYGALLDLLAATRGQKPFFGQLLIEIHAMNAPRSAKIGTAGHKIFELMYLLKELGYRIFSRETNLEPAVDGRLPDAVEYSFIHREAWNARQAQIMSQNVVEYTPQLRRLSPSVEGGGVIYYLSHMRNLDKMREALESLHYNFNWQYRYPVKVFHQEFTEEAKLMLKAISDDLYDISFVDVGDMWEAPLPVAEGTTVPDKCRCSPRNSDVGYRRMIQFHAFQASEMLSGMGYAWMWRLDDDSRFSAPIGYDPFRLMAVNGWLYGTATSVYDDGACVEGLWDLAIDFAASRELPHGTSFLDQVPPSVVFYNNFEISAASVWKSEIFQEWKAEVLKHGGIFTRRWGDAPIHTLGVALSLSPGEVHYLEDVGYTHQLIRQRSNWLTAWRFQQQQVGNGTNGTNSSNGTVGTRKKQDLVGVLGRMPLIRYPISPLTPPVVVRARVGVALATVVKEPNPSANLSNAVLYTLASEHFERNLERLFRSFGKHFLKERPFPLVVFFDDKDTTILEEAQAALLALASDPTRDGQGLYQARLINYGDSVAPTYGQPLVGAYLPFPVRLWGVPGLLQAPAWMQAAAAAAAAAAGNDPGTATAGAASDWELGYQYAHNLRLVDLLSSELSYDWLWRLNPDAELKEPVKYDVFAEVSRRGARYVHAGYMLTKDSDFGPAWDRALRTSRTLWTKNLADPDMEELELSEAPLLHAWAKRAVAPVFATQTEISHASLWSAPAARLVLRDLERNGLTSRHVSGHMIAVLATVTSTAEMLEMTDLDLPYSDWFSPWVRPLPETSVEFPGVLSSARWHLSVSPALTKIRGVAPQAVGWLGGDSGASVPLPLARGAAAEDVRLQQRLWLFGDTLLGMMSPDKKTRGDFWGVVPSSIGRSFGERLSPASFEWGEAGLDDSKGSAIFQCESEDEKAEGCLLWLVAGLAVLDERRETRLVLVAKKVVKTSVTDQYQLRFLGTAVIIVDNPFDHASQWVYRMKDIPGGGTTSWSSGIAAASGSMWAELGDKVYLTGVADVAAHEAWMSGRQVLGRIEVSDLLGLNLGRLEVLTGAPSGLDGKSLWLELGLGLQMSPGEAPEPADLFGTLDSEGSLMWSPGLGAWLAVGLNSTRGGSALTLRLAAAPEGPWGPATRVVMLPEDLTRRSKGCYAPKLHHSPGADHAGAVGPGGSEVDKGADVVMSVTCAPLFADVRTMMKLDVDVYTPRFFAVRLVPP